MGLDEFCRTIPRDFHAYHDRHAQAREREVRLVGNLICAIVNNGFRRREKPLTLKDLGVGTGAPPPASSPTPQSVFAACNVWRAVAGAQPLPLLAPELFYVDEG